MLNLKKQVNNLKLNKNVLFTGLINNVNEYLAISDLFVLPSFYESFGLSIIEAMASKVFCIATNTGGIPEIIQDNITGYLFENNNSEDLLLKIKLFLNKNTEDIVNNAYNLVKKKFSLDIMNNNLIKIYEGKL